MRGCLLELLSGQFLNGVCAVGTVGVSGGRGLTIGVHHGGEHPRSIGHVLAHDRQADGGIGQGDGGWERRMHLHGDLDDVPSVQQQGARLVWRISV